MFRGLLLDLDDTLFDRAAAFERWVAERAGRVLEPAVLGALVEVDRRGHRPRAEFAADAARLGLDVDPDAFPFELAEHVVPEPGVRATIEALAPTRRIAIVTNGGAAQRAKLARLGLADVVHEVFVSSELGVAKPDPAMFARALAFTGLAAPEVLFVGDHPVIDLAPAAALGMATGWRARSAWPAGLARPTYTLASIGELREVCA